MKGVHFQIVIDNSEWGNIFILKPNICASSRGVSNKNKTHFDSQIRGKYKRCVDENVSVYYVDLADDINSKIENSRYFCSRSSDEELDESLIETVHNHMTSSECRSICQSKRLITIAMSGYFLSQFYKTLVCSSNYRHYVMQNFFYVKPLVKYKNNFQCIYINVVSLGFGVIDYKWNHILMNMCLERRELDNAMSWLSTLGGAFSSLGEQYKHFAWLAGRTSVEQFNLALRLGDDLIVARCKLYYALSLIQMGRLRSARRIIKQQYEFATSGVVVDKRLVRMCQGIWAKMKFEHKRKHKICTNNQVMDSNICTS